MRLDFKFNLPARGPHDPKQRQLRVAKIVKEIVLKGDYSPQQVEALAQGAHRCPVMNTLLNPPEIEEKISVER